MSYTYAFIVSDEPINLLTVNLPPHIGVNDTHPMHNGSRCIVLYNGGNAIADGIDAVLAVYPDARATTSKAEAANWLKGRHITPHKGGRTIKRSSDVTPETNERLAVLRDQYGISLGDLIEEAAAAKLAEFQTDK